MAQELDLEFTKVELDLESIKVELDQVSTKVEHQEFIRQEADPMPTNQVPIKVEQHLAHLEFTKPALQQPIKVAQLAHQELQQPIKEAVELLAAMEPLEHLRLIKADHLDHQEFTRAGPVGLTNPTNLGHRAFQAVTNLERTDQEREQVGVLGPRGHRAAHTPPQLTDTRRNEG